MNESPTRVDFYLLSAPGEQERMRTACRVVDKAWQRGLKVWVWAGDDEHLQSLDDLLWTFRQDSFVPHETIAESAPSEEPSAPVLLSVQASSLAHTDVLINLSGKLPERASLPPRIAEFVGPEADARARGRDRFRGYRDMNCELTTHEL